MDTGTNLLETEWRAGAQLHEILAYDNVSDKPLKRAFDVTVSMLLLPVLALTVFPVVALFIALESRGGVFFIQKRTGLNRKTFYCIKFRTMYPLRYGKGRHDQDRVTKVGKILRQIHIDELPQLFNVLLGDMSLVGPRPHMLKDTLLFEAMEPRYSLRHNTRPGITGYAQVNGYYGTVDTPEHLVIRTQYDIAYIKDWSLLFDIKLLLKTLTLPSRTKTFTAISPTNL